MADKFSQEQENGLTSFLGWFFGPIMPVQEVFVLPWLLYSRPSTKYFLPQRTLFKFLCPHRPASWAGSRAGSPVSKCVPSLREPTELVYHFAYRGNSHRHKGAASHLFDLVWLYRSPIRVERNGVFY